MNYHGRLLTLIPVEALATYTTIAGIARSFPPDRFEILIISLIFLTILLPFYMWFAVSDRNIRRIAVVIVSFIIWAINIDSPFGGFLGFQPWHATLPLVLWTFIIPTIKFR